MSIIAICRNPNTWKVPWCDTPSSDFFSAAQPICNSLHCTTAAQLQLALSSVRNGTGFPWTGLQVRTKTNSGQMVRPFQGKRQDYVGLQNSVPCWNQNQTAISSRNFAKVRNNIWSIMVHAPSNENLSFSWLLFGQSRYVACKFWRFQTWKVYMEQPMKTPKEVLLCPAMICFSSVFSLEGILCASETALRLWVPNFWRFQWQEVFYF